MFSPSEKTEVLCQIKDSIYLMEIEMGEERPEVKQLY